MSTMILAYITRVRSAVAAVSLRSWPTHFAECLPRVCSFISAPLLVLASFIAAMPAEAQNSFTPLNWPNDNTQATIAYAMSADGTTVVGRSFLGPGESFYNPSFEWQDGAMSDPCIGWRDSLMPGVSLETCVLTGVSGNGFLLAATASGTAQGSGGTVLYGGVGWYFLNFYLQACPPTGTCSSGPMGSKSTTFAVSAGGSGYVAQMTNTGNEVTFSPPFVLPGGYYDYVTGINSDASVIVGQANTCSPNNCRGTSFYWYNGMICDFDPAGTEAAAVYGVNEYGTVAVGQALGGQYEGPVRWNGLSRDHCAVGTITNLGGLPGAGATAGQAFAVNESGGVIVGTTPDANGNSKAFRWTAYDGMQSIEQLLADSRTGFHGLSQLTTAIAVSDDGTVIAGNGIDSETGVARAWRAVIALPNRPLPFIAAPTTGQAPLRVTFSANGLTLPMNYTVNFGDGTKGALTQGSCINPSPIGGQGSGGCSGSASHNYTTAGTYTATLVNASNSTLGLATISVGDTHVVHPFVSSTTRLASPPPATSTPTLHSLDQ
jgi:uncharacterized membrane protein